MFSALDTEFGTFSLMYALDQVGRSDLRSASRDFAALARKYPLGVVMAKNSLMGAITYNIQPMPIPFSNADAPSLIVNTLYDERTSIQGAQDYRANFVDSELVTVQGGGHCVGGYNGICGYLHLMQFFADGSRPGDGYVCPSYSALNYTSGAQTALRLFEVANALAKGN